MHKIKGRVLHVGATEQVTDKFKKRLLVIETDGKFDNLIPVEFKQDNVERVDGVTVGEEVEVSVFIGGREWNGKYFPSITGAKVERLTPAEPEMSPEEARKAQIRKELLAEMAAEKKTGSDDLPF